LKKEGKCSNLKALITKISLVSSYYRLCIDSTIASIYLLTRNITIDAVLRQKIQQIRKLCNGGVTKLRTQLEKKKKVYKPEELQSKQNSV